MPYPFIPLKKVERAQWVNSPSPGPPKGPPLLQHVTGVSIHLNVVRIDLALAKSLLMWGECQKEMVDFCFKKNFNNEDMESEKKLNNEDYDIGNMIPKNHERWESRINVNMWIPCITPVDSPNDGFSPMVNERITLSILKPRRVSRWWAVSCERLSSTRWLLVSYWTVSIHRMILQLEPPPPIPLTQLPLQNTHKMPQPPIDSWQVDLNLGWISEAIWAIWW